jgi:hypothetical protein
MPEFLGFLRNLTDASASGGANAGEFVAPVQAETREAAAAALVGQYPESFYRLHTVYARRELVQIMENLNRWPGVASTVQPPLEQLLSRVSGRTGGLPPMPKADAGRVQAVAATPTEPQAQLAEIQKLEELQAMALKLKIPGAQELANRLLAEARGAALPANQAMPMGAPASAPPSARGVAEASAPLPAMPAAAQSGGTSAIFMLKQLRGR